MKLIRILVLALAMVAGLGAAWLMKSMSDTKQPVIKVNAPTTQVAKVLTAARDIAPGDKLGAGSLKWQDWPKAAVTSTLITRSRNPSAISKYTRATARARFVSGEPIVSRKLVLKNGGGFMSAILLPGKRAVSIKISAETGAGGFILPNDRVDVILTSSGASMGRPGEVSAQTILRNIRVLAIDQTIESKRKGKVVVGKTATLELSSRQAEIIAQSEKKGVLSLALRSLADSTGDKPDKRDPLELSGPPGPVTVLRYGIATTVNPKY